MKGGDSRKRKNGPFPRAEGAETPLSREEGDGQADAGANASATLPAVGAPAEAPRGISRRGLFGLAGAGVAGVGLGIAADRGVQALAAAGAPAAGSTVYPFYQEHQAGIVTPAQDRLHFAAFDLAPGATRADLISLLQDWTTAAAALTAGHDIGDFGAVGGSYDAPPEDTGEAFGLPPAGLTITVGFGPTLFTTSAGVDRFGIASARPHALAELPHFPGDQLDAARSGGDLCIQACADDPQVAVHAIRNLSRIAFGRAAIRWSQLGFGRTSSTSTSQATPRNLFGFKDGTANVKAEQPAVVDEQVWVGAGDGPAWLAGGSYLVARRIRMTIETWDRTALREQETVFGRTKGEGAPLSGGTEFTEPDFAATGKDGTPLIDRASHMRLAHPAQNNGVQLLRRGYNFVDGNDDLGRLEAGLFFISYQRRPSHFTTVQLALARHDAMNEYVRHVGSALFAVPPGAARGSYLGAALFA
ncbi:MULTISPECIES: iron uptake transporter deferrochelatase/peroxidase subunit [unclassified Cryobacterium]|uniref:iron uptake transporter deferrochelatase/peroxidase subunit n=1 Tax=unclassified Cryobacterium TaxID=2649013 RepID=UPI002AB5AB62|nr:MULTISPECIES: iron uptake transporter deferrochelatase/peroxidase subunit [unclassified Cryobacterium]MDY7543163.1 iron uptake transporter deferrochelatase/peroxidase subunit [Cryobacterium sp. 5B3]MEA9998848.1 iron uptake transporter deferrochelatase/peroxidase subunit [Cryobacterium sp. RTS3]MEB0266707.1 iron uptake transporter deferrochelatase/peroxidase subunit [Cryobacterium sp. 10I5]MEB0275548.1 iron uptake transporter deferrochelatase/peroxidase subunit [Cryobacterium sp. 5B3]